MADFGGRDLTVTILAILDLAVPIYDSTKKSGSNFHGNFDLIPPLFQCLGAKNVPLANLYDPVHGLNMYVGTLNKLAVCMGTITYFSCTLAVQY